MDDQGVTNYAWQNITHIVDPKVTYNPRSNTVRFHFQDDDNTAGAWCYNVMSKRWDLEIFPVPLSITSGAKSESFLSDGEHLYKLNDVHTTRKKYSWHSRQLDMGFSTIDKTFRNIKVEYKSAANAPLITGGSTGTIEFYIDDTKIATSGITTQTKGNEITYKIKSTSKRGKKLQIRITDCTEEIDSIGIVYALKSVK